MLAINSPEFTQENLLFEGPAGQMLRHVTYTNGAEHLYEVNEATGKQMHVSYKTILAQEEQVLKMDAQDRVEAHTNYTVGANKVEHSQMDWSAAIDEIFDKNAPHKQPEVLQTRETLTQFTSVNENGQSVVDTDGMVNAIFGRHKAEESASTAHSLQAQTEKVLPYTAVMKASSDPTSIEHALSESGASESVAYSSHFQAAEGANSDPILPVVLGMVVMGKGLKGGATKPTDKSPGLHRRLVDYEQRKFDAARGYYNTDNKDANGNRKWGTALAIGVVATLALLVGVTNCGGPDEGNDKSISSASPKPSASSSVEKPGTGENTDKPDKDQENPDPDTKPEKPSPTSIDLKPGGKVWYTAHGLLKNRGYYHTVANTDAIKDKMLRDMGKTEAQAWQLAVGTAVPLYTNDQIEDILDDSSNTTSKKVKK